MKSRTIHLKPARYFPVEARALRLAAGLSRLGTDFGNGARDSQFFQLDDEQDRYRTQRLAAPPQRHLLLARSAADLEIHGAILDWMAGTIETEHGIAIDLAAAAAAAPMESAGAGSVRSAGGLCLSIEAPAHVSARPASPTTQTRDCGVADVAAGYATVALAIQEDFAILRREGERETTLALFVSFPSAWRPERLLGADFAALHAPVPGFPGTRAAGSSMVAAMVERGPYTRFVWSVHPDDELDHHPEEGRRCAWDDARALWLRVERQVLVPFATLDASLFLIRTYLYRHDTLAPEQRAVLAAAIRATQGSVRVYKGFDARALAFLQSSRTQSPPAL